MSWPLDQPIRSTFLTYSNAAKTILADATTVVLHLIAPDGTSSTPTVVHDSTGTYHYDAPDGVSGLFQYRWVATGAVATSSPAGAFYVWDAAPPVLVGLDDARQALNVTSTVDDDEIQTVIYTASALLLNHPVYRVKDVVVPTTYTQWADGGRETIVLDHYPVAAVTSITEYIATNVQVVSHEPLDGGTFTGYGWDYQDGSGANGILIRTTSGEPICWRGNRVKIVYTVGAGQVPADIRGAALDLLTHLWETQRGGQGVSLPSGIDLNEAPRTFGEQFGPAFALPNRVREQLEPYKRGPLVA